MNGSQSDLFADDGAVSLSESDTSADETSEFAPLAARLRPCTLADYIGQSHLLSPGKPLRTALERGQCYSMILWGPPGVGKTTLALIFARACRAVLEQIPAVTSGVKDIRAAIERAELRRRQGVKTLLFVDEVHRFNKSQQDAFLPHIENGTITFIGATTENPSFNLNAALLSRARVYVLKRLTEGELHSLIELALNSPKGLLKEKIKLADSVEKTLIEFADGDARHLLNMLEMAADLASPLKEGGKIITRAMVGAVAGRKLINYDKGGDAFYDLISAFHKSVRGSAPDAALYWYSRILEAGGDPLYVARRLLAIATEDVGLADPRAMQVALNAWDIFERVGAAEGERAIAEAAVYLAIAPKSNHLYTAFHKAREDARNNGTSEVPLYLRNAPTKLMEELGYKQGYRYAHDYEGAYAAGESFFPEELTGTVYYQPSDRGLEKQLADKLEYLRKKDRAEVNKRYPSDFKGRKVRFDENDRS
ncbi:MAG: replication-associated recombination protein A [Succinivibrio sp.]|nr:replication-associated recombination protein A [Succinivibrio sp.]